MGSREFSRARFCSTGLRSSATCKSLFLDFAIRWVGERGGSGQHRAALLLSAEELLVLLLGLLEGILEQVGVWR